MPDWMHLPPWEYGSHPCSFYWPLWEAVGLLHSARPDRDDVERVTATLRSIVRGSHALTYLGFPPKFVAIARRLIRRLDPCPTPGKPSIPAKQAKRRDLEALGEFVVVRQMVRQTRKQNPDPQSWRHALVTLYGEAAVPPLLKVTHSGYRKKVADGEVTFQIVLYRLNVGERTLKGRLSRAMSAMRPMKTASTAEFRPGSFDRAN